jgi:hypothetical protein
MPVRVPSNQVITSKYTIGKEFILESTYKDYQGYYYEFNSGYYGGKEFSTSAPKLLKADSNKVNPLLKNPNTYTYGKISKIVLPSSTPPPPIKNTLEGKLTEDPNGSINLTAYYYKTQVGNDILIREISRETFDQYQNNPIYQTIAVKVDLGDLGIENEELKRVESIMPGFSDWYLYQRIFNS